MELPTFKPGESARFYGDGTRQARCAVRVVRWPEDADLPPYRVPVVDAEFDQIADVSHLARVNPLAAYGLEPGALPDTVSIDTKREIEPGDVVAYLGTRSRRGQWAVVVSKDSPEWVVLAFPASPIRLVSVWDLCPAGCRERVLAR